MEQVEKDQSNARLKILIVAAAVHPEKGSEPGLGWGWIEALSGYHDLYVITGEREGNREAIEKCFQKNPRLFNRLKLHFIPRPDGSFLEKWWPLYYYRNYRHWHQSAYRLACELDKEVGFDLVHQLNMTGYREPGYLWRFNLPFVWGPVGGTANVPLRFASVLGPLAFIYHVAKVSVNNYQLKHNKRVKAALDRADGFVTSTSDTRDRFKKILGRDSVRINDTGPPPILSLDNSLKKSRPTQYIIKLSWSGLHVSRKALPIVLRALALLPGELVWHLDIIGQGPMTSRWKRLAKNLKINQKCTWYGWLKKDEAIKIVANSDLFLFPSLHEGTPTVVFESMSVGVPVICLDHCGQADIVNESCGVKIPVTTPNEVIWAYAEEISRLARNPEEIDRLSRGALRRVEDFSWDKKAQTMLEIYKSSIKKWNSKLS